MYTRIKEADLYCVAASEEMTKSHLDRHKFWSKKMYDFSNKSIKYYLIFDIPCVFLKKRQINRKKVNIHSLYNVLLKHCTCGSFRVVF